MLTALTLRQTVSCSQLPALDLEEGLFWTEIFTHAHKLSFPCPIQTESEAVEVPFSCPASAEVFAEALRVDEKTMRAMAAVSAPAVASAAAPPVVSSAIRAAPVSVAAATSPR